MKKRAVIYARYSSDKQQENSIETQHAICQEYCKQQGFEIVGYYTDRATSAYRKTKKRTEFLRMIQDSEKGKFDFIVIYSFDRFSRKRFDNAVFKHKLKQNNVRVISATESVGDGAESLVFESLYEAWAEYYSAKLSERVSAGMYNQAKKGMTGGGQTPLGFKVSGKLLEPDPLTAPIVKEAFERYAAGESITSIKEDFNRKGYKTKKGNAFNKSSFYHMFRNKKYMGTFTYLDIEIENAFEPIVSKEVFEEVQRLCDLKAHAPAAGKSKVEFLLTFKLVCGHCGNFVVGTSGTSASGKTYYYYQCNNKCGLKPIRKEIIEEKIMSATNSLLKPEVIEELATLAMREVNRQNKEHSLVPALEQDIRDIDNSLNNLIKVLEKLPDSPITIQRIKELEQNKKVAIKRLKEEKDNYIDLDKDKVIFWLNKFLTGDIKNIRFRRNLIRFFVNTITVTNSDKEEGFSINIIYNLDSENLP